MMPELIEKTVTKEHVSLKRKRKLLNVQIREKHDKTLKSKTEILKITEGKETIQLQFDTTYNIQTAEEVNILNKHHNSDISHTASWGKLYR